MLDVLIKGKMELFEVFSTEASGRVKDGWLSGMLRGNGQAASVLPSTAILQEVSFHSLTEAKQFSWLAA